MLMFMHRCVVVKDRVQVRSTERFLSKTAFWHNFSSRNKNMYLWALMEREQSRHTDLLLKEPLEVILNSPPVSDSSPEFKW